MGARESSTRKVSFGLDEEDTVRVLNGVKLSEEVLQRMRDSARRTDFKPPPPASHKQEPGSPPGPTAAEMQEEVRRRFEKEQAMVREELAQIARREREAAREGLSRAVLRERALTREETEKASRLPAELDASAKQLEKKEAELKLLDAFYREQLAQLEKKNLDYYKMSSRKFQEAATTVEDRVKRRSTEPVCTALQAQILRCFRENGAQTLSCSPLAKEYIQCIDAAKKEAGNSGLCTCIRIGALWKDRVVSTTTVINSVPGPRSPPGLCL